MQPAHSSVSVRIAANFTVEPIEEFLAFWLGQLGIEAEIRFAPYNQVFQQLLEGGLLRTNTGGINVVALDLDTWLVAGPIEETRVHLQRTVEETAGNITHLGCSRSRRCGTVVSRLQRTAANAGASPCDCSIQERHSEGLFVHRWLDRSGSFRRSNALFSVGNARLLYR